MGSLYDYFRENYSHGADKNRTAEQMKRQEIKNTISALCEKYLTDAGQVFTFEVAEKDLPYVIVVIDEEPLKSMYNIIQVSKVLFEASLKELAF